MFMDLCMLQMHPTIKHINWFNKSSDISQKVECFSCCYILSCSMFEAPRRSSRPCVRSDQKSWVPRRTRDTFHLWSWLYIESNLQICMHERRLADSPSGNVLLWVTWLHVLLFHHWLNDYCCCNPGVIDHVEGWLHDLRSILDGQITTECWWVLHITPCWMLHGPWF